MSSRAFAIGAVAILAAVALAPRRANATPPAAPPAPGDTSEGTTPPADDTSDEETEPPPAGASDEETEPPPTPTTPTTPAPPGGSPFPPVTPTPPAGPPPLTPGAGDGGGSGGGNPYEGQPPRFTVNEYGASNGDDHTAAVRLYTATANGEGLSRDAIAALQRRMGINGDGVMGAGTRDRVAELLIAQGNGAGSTLQRQAALAYSLARYQGVTSTGTVRNLQLRMGGGIEADGLAGPLTDARAAALLATP